MTSRIDKMVREAGGIDRLGDAAQLRAQPVTLFVSEATSLTLARSAVALALRCFRGPVHLLGLTKISSTLHAAVMEEATEYGAAERISFEQHFGALALGVGCRSGDMPFVTAAGWIAGINREVVGPAPAAPAAAFAAAGGIAKLFRIMLKASPSTIHESWQLSLWTFSPEGDGPDGSRIDMGRVLAIGAGAIGSGLAHVLRHSGWQGHIEFVDRQLYDEPNHETTLLISQQNARERVRKAETLAGLLASSSVTSHGVLADVDEHHPLLSEDWRALVVGVDNAELRRVLDNVRMPVYNAGVGGSRDDAGHVLWSRHDSAARDHVLSSLYRLTTEQEPTSASPPSDVLDECSRVAYADVSLAAPFLGLSAGALLAAGLARGVDQGDPNFLKLDLLGEQRFVIGERRRQR
jgi:hypothetical protein